MNIKQQAAKGIIWSAIQNWGSQAGSLIIFLVLARLLSPVDFGLIALANTFLSFVNIVIDQGFSLALIQRTEIEEEHLNTAFWAQICLGLGFTLLGFTGASLIAGIFDQPLLAPVLKWFSVLFLISSLNIIQQTLLRRRLEFQKIAVRTLLSIFLSGIVGIVLALLGYGVWSLVGQQLTYEVVGVIFFWSVSEWQPKFQFSWPHFKALSGFGISVFFSKLLVFFNQNTDTLLIGYFLGEVALGFYAIAYRILQVLTQLLVGTANQVALPVFSRLQDDPERFLRTFYKTTKLSSLIALPTFLGVISLAPELLRTVFGQQWNSSVPIMQVLAVGGIVYFILYFNRSVFIALGKPLWRLRLDCVNVILNVATCLFAVRWGILAMAFAYVISDLMIIPLSLWYLRQLIGVSLRDYFNQFSSTFICTGLMVATIGVLRYGLASKIAPQVLLMACTLSGVAVYAFSLRYLAPKLFSEVYELANSKKLKNTNDA